MKLHTVFKDMSGWFRFTYRKSVFVLVCVSIAAAGCSSADSLVVSACTVAECDDGNECTNDTCSAQGQCVHTARTGACNDKDVCTSQDHCVDTACVATPTNCDDKIACTADHCDPSIGCVHLADSSTLCDDKNPCTDDACKPGTGCAHENNTAPCNDGSKCSLDEVCAGGSCQPGTTSVLCDDKNPCTTDSCDPKDGSCIFLPSNVTCEDGNDCTVGDRCQGGSCTAGALDCACAVKKGQTFPKNESCDTPIDDNCDGFINEGCGAVTYKFNAPPECGFVCYYDEGHNKAVNGKADDPAGHDQYATGQLLDGARGVDDWAYDQGNGAAYEWVAWLKASPIITVQFPKLRNVSLVRLGLSNRNDGAVIQPPEINVRLSADGLKWTPFLKFTLADGTEPAIPNKQRGDIELKLPAQAATMNLVLQPAMFVEITFPKSKETPPPPDSWKFIDELEFD